MVTLSPPKPSAKPTCRDCGGTGDDGSLRDCPACRGTGKPSRHPVDSRHPLYEIRDRANQLECDIIGSKIDDTEALLSNVLTLTTLVRGLIAVAIGEMEATHG